MSFNSKRRVLVDHNGSVAANGKLERKLFVLDTLQSNDNMHNADTAVNENTESLWYQRSRNLGKTNLRLLKDKNLVNGMNFQSSEDREVCDSCVKGKQARAPFPKGQAKRATEILQIVHTDVCGPMKTKSAGGSSYFVTFIHGKSRLTAIYFMKTKDKVFDKFLEYKAMVTNRTGKKIKALHSDNGGEYLSKTFSDYLMKKGIKRQLLVPRTPEQNGVAERANRTIQETARSMLCGAGLPVSFWFEAVITAVKNRSPTIAVKGMTPYECFYGKKPDVRNLKVFGCTAYMHIPKEK